MDNSMSEAVVKLGVEFEKFFGMSDAQFKLLIDPLLSKVVGRLELDLIKFDAWLHKQGYSEKKHGSARDFVEMKYGKGAVDLINSLFEV